MALMPDRNAETGRVSVWQCIGCGKIEGPQPCIGVCEDRKVDMVYATVHEDTVARLAAVSAHAKLLETLVSRLAHATPREGEWEVSYRRLQSEARAVLAAKHPGASLD